MYQIVAGWVLLPVTTPDLGYQRNIHIVSIKDICMFHNLDKAISCISSKFCSLTHTDISDSGALFEIVRYQECVVTNKVLFKINGASSLCLVASVHFTPSQPNFQLTKSQEGWQLAKAV